MGMEAFFKIIAALILLTVLKLYGPSALFITVGVLFIFHIGYRLGKGHWLGDEP